MKKTIKILLAVICVVCTGVNGVYAAGIPDQTEVYRDVGKETETKEAETSDENVSAAPADGNEESAGTEDSSLKTDGMEENNIGEGERKQQVSEEGGSGPMAGADIRIREGTELEPEEAEALGLKADAVFFTADAAPAGRSGDQVTLTIGKTVKYGSYTTNYFYINGQLAYCLDPKKGTPGGGDYAAEILKNGALRKAMYYLMGGPGWAEVEPAFAGQTQDMSYAYCHCVLSWIYNGYDDSIFLGFGALGPGNNGENFCKNVASWIAEDFPEPPSSHIAVTPPSQQAVFDNISHTQKTGNYYLDADPRNSLTVQLPSGVTYHNAGNGASGSGSVTIAGGTSFYLEAEPWVNGEWSSGALKGSVSNEYLSFVIKMSGGSQDIGGLVHTEPEENTGFTAVWTGQGRIRIKKTSAEDGTPLEGALFTVSRKDGEMLAELSTDENGTAYSPLLPPGVTYLVKEVRAPQGYRIQDETDQGTEVYLDPGASLEDGVPTVLVEQENPLALCSLEVKKKIRVEDIVWAHGNPVFLFTVSGQDLAGNYHVYSGVIEFDEAYVRESGKKNGMVERSVIFTGIPCGTSYRVQEAETSRYQLTEVTTQDKNVTITKLSEPSIGKLPDDVYRISADLFQKPEGSCIVFSNEKVKWNLLTHTDTITNRVQIK